MELREEVRVAWGTGIAGHVAESGEPVNIPDAYQVTFNHHFRFKIATKSIFKSTWLKYEINNTKRSLLNIAQYYSII